MDISPAIHFIRKGILDTLQDRGRYGYQHLGIAPAGVMDRVAMRMANALTGNLPDTAVIEMHFPGPGIQFTCDSLIALSGSDALVLLNKQEPIPINRTVYIQAGSTLHIEKGLNGQRLYLAIRGGFATSGWLNSCSTALVFPKGGRIFDKNDVLPVKTATTLELPNGFALPWFVPAINYSNKIRFIPGQAYQQLTADSLERLSETFTISNNSNRMGYRLNGPAMVQREAHELLSSAVVFGTIQLLPSGQLIILMADHQTTGGYPCLGHVISTDLPALAQMGAGNQLELEAIDLLTATALRREQEKDLTLLENAINFRIEAFLKRYGSQTTN
jgi:antagonist of KipI